MSDHSNVPPCDGSDALACAHVASFCTFLRSHEDGVDQELLNSVANAM